MFRVKVAAIAGVLTIAALCSTLIAARAGTQEAAANQPRTVWDGVYTEEQSKRGETVYRATCATCHGTNLQGGEMAGALAGPTFTSSWNSIDLGQLFERIRKTMPDDNPGVLTKDEAGDVLAFVLSANKFPAGKIELPKQTELLNQIKLLAAKPSAH